MLDIFTQDFGLDKRRGLILLFIVWTGLIVLMAHGMVTDNVNNIFAVPSIYSDIKQIEDNKLTVKDIYIEDNSYYKEDYNYLLPAKENND